MVFSLGRCVLSRVRLVKLYDSVRVVIGMIDMCLVRCRYLVVVLL